MTKYFIALAMLLAVGAGCLPVLENPGAEPDGDYSSVDETPICKNTCGNGTCEEVVCQGTGCPCAETVNNCAQDCSVEYSQIEDLIVVAGPANDAQISSPVTITGTARGNWYFEASFPIKIYDSNNVLLGSGIAQAQSDWMTTNFVPFTAVITFAPATTATGTIVLEKDNPSGLPANDNSLTIPVTF